MRIITYQCEKIRLQNIIPYLKINDDFVIRTNEKYEVLVEDLYGKKYNIVIKCKSILKDNILLKNEILEKIPTIIKIKKIEINNNSLKYNNKVDNEVLEIFTEDSNRNEVSKESVSPNLKDNIKSFGDNNHVISEYEPWYNE